MRIPVNPLPALPGYTPREEIANSVTHGIGIVLAIAGTYSPAASADAAR